MGEERTRGSSDATEAGPLDPAFEALAERTIQTVFRHPSDPGTLIAPRFPSGRAWPDVSEEGIATERSILQSLQREYARFRDRPLHPRQQVDHRLASGWLDSRVEELSQRPAWRCRPQAVLEEMSFGFALFLSGRPLNEAQRNVLLARLRALPELLAQARATLSAPPPVHTECAIVRTEEALRHLPPAISARTDSEAAGAFRRSLERAAPPAWRSLEEYLDYLRGELMPRATGEFRLGRTAFQHTLRQEHCVPYALEDLVQFGQRHYHETLREIREVAARIRPGCNWSRLLLELDGEPPLGADLIGAYRDAVEEVRAFVQERALVSLPAEASLEVRLTPPFLRRRVVFARHVPGEIMGAEDRDMLLVSGSEPGDDPSRRRSLLHGHSRYAIPLRAARESYPGRYVQHTQARGCGRPLRNLFPSALLIEGWALLGTELLRCAGFPVDDRVRLLQLRDELLCACRVLIDIGLHTGQLSFIEAIAFLVRKAKLDRASAVEEVRCCCQSPTLPLSCILGKFLLADLREDARTLQGARFDPKAFHDAVLDAGPIPPALLRRELELPPRDGRRDALRGFLAAGRRRRPRSADSLD